MNLKNASVPEKSRLKHPVALTDRSFPKRLFSAASPLRSHFLFSGFNRGELFFSVVRSVHRVPEISVQRECRHRTRYIKLIQAHVYVSVVQPFLLLVFQHVLLLSLSPSGWSELQHSTLTVMCSAGFQTPLIHVSETSPWGALKPRFFSPTNHGLCFSSLPAPDWSQKVIAKGLNYHKVSPRNLLK